ncbi:alpha-1,2-Mannosidase [Paramicrosporidium saccamoebae]|uniref:alpha-1,2-Mannosidase n=1 Tax=Paramicrosporidium saccamoebae TaxID=1246581 RepID=A0A2H9TMP3_9FUNG|nr:alpha-1,2-Mannosidase [Paramicrosporidium saccamoebae]
MLAVLLVTIVAAFALLNCYGQSELPEMVKGRMNKSPPEAQSKPLDDAAEYGGEKYEPGMELARQMMRHSWAGYRKYAWGHDALRPLSRTGHNTTGLLTDMISSLDTLMMLRMDAEYLEAKACVLDQLNFDKTSTVSMAEMGTTIMGGLLGAFAMTNDGRYVTKVFDLATRLARNFDDLEVFPDDSIDLNGYLDRTNLRV